MEKEREKFNKLVERINEMKKKGEVDLSMEEDLSIGIMNLVSLEEHFFFTASKTGKDEYFDFLKEIREVRKFLLAKMINKHEGETWCITKHLLAATMRLIEVGTKFQGDGKKNEAKEVFERAYKVYSLFWAIRLKLIDLENVKKIPDNKLSVSDKGEKKDKKGWSVREIVDKLVDCCDE